MDSRAGRPRITFGIIVLNGEPFTRHTLRALYPYAHEIIVAEGAAPGARGIATEDGHSRDGTLEALREFQQTEDPEKKVSLVTAEDEGHPSGFWPGEKDEQSRAYASRATGDYLWQVDIDEFYLPTDIECVSAMLADDPSIAGAAFRQTTFWGALDYWTDSWYLRQGASDYHRLFRWGRGYSYASHRPPTVLDQNGDDVRTGNYLSADELSARGIRLFHYSLLFPKQVREKCDYYAHAHWSRRTGALAWAEQSYDRLEQPYRVHNVYAYPSWLERYDGVHPPEVERMIANARATGEPRMRPTRDVEELLDSRSYQIGRWLLRTASPLQRPLMSLERRVRRKTDD